MKLISILLPDAKPVSMGNMRAFDHRYISCTHPLDGTLGWVIAIRGGTVFVIVPPVAEQRSGPKYHPGAYEFPRAQCVPVWDETDPEKYMKPEQNYTSEPLRRAAPPPVPEMDEPKAVA